MAGTRERVQDQRTRLQCYKVRKAARAEVLEPGRSSSPDGRKEIKKRKVGLLGFGVKLVLGSYHGVATCVWDNQAGLGGLAQGGG
jgi:hypothetical protein